MVNDFYHFGDDILRQTLDESVIEYSFELGNGVTAHFGTREGKSIMVIENAPGSLSGALYAGD